MTADSEGQTRVPPETAEHGRTVVRIAAPASVLKPRPRFTVHDIRALSRLRFFLSYASRARTKKKRGSCGARVFRRGVEVIAAIGNTILARDSEDSLIDGARERERE